jgi:L-ascorbate metabolism protein UlaG (beta-lactamase superfamily)
MKLTYYGQSGFSVEVKGKKILFDPFIKNNPLSKNIDVNSVEADYIFISHGHSDHVADVIEIAQRTGAKCVGAAEVSGWLEKNGVSNSHPMNHGASIKFEFGNVRGVSAIHSSSFPDGSYAGNPMGFVFTTDEGNFYFAGDTCLTMDMKLIPHFAKLNFAVLPIGGNFTMDATDAIIASDFIQCNTIVGVHYDTFDLIKIDTEKAIADFKAAGKKLLLPAVGETIDIVLKKQ